MNIVILGAHCDDPEAGCGGLALVAVQKGHQVHLVYASSGVPGRTIDGKPESAVREQEALAACRRCGAQAHFLRFDCSNVPFNQASVKTVSDLLRRLDADAVFTHWPVDTHPDHQAVGALGTQVVVGNPDLALAYYESCPNVQSIAFTPNRWVEISDVAHRKKEMVRCHASQNVDAWWMIHDNMGKVRFTQLHGFTDRENVWAEGYFLAVSTPQVETLFATRTWLQPSGSRAVRKCRHEDIPL